jgi:hypothetical protein
VCVRPRLKRGMPSARLGVGHRMASDAVRHDRRKAKVFRLNTVGYGLPQLCYLRVVMSQRLG